jgi:hypothetical protein
VIPDQRYCFDVCRPLTGLGRLIDAHLRPAPTHSAGTVAEYFLNVVSKGGMICWPPGDGRELAFVHSPEEARQALARQAAGEYVDVHAWCFTPHSFRLLLHDLYCLGHTALQEVDFFPSAGYEFFVTLGRRGTGPGLGRLKLLERVREELAEGWLATPAPLVGPESLGRIRGAIARRPGRWRRWAAGVRRPLRRLLGRLRRAG